MEKVVVARRERSCGDVGDLKTFYHQKSFS